MKSNFVPTVKNSALLYCVIFTVATLADNIWQLCRGQIADSNYHIINRAVVILIAVITITLFDKFRLKSKLLSHIISYAISMIAVFTYVWFTSFLDPLGPGAYQGIFVIYTLLTILLSVIIEIKERIKRKRQSITN
ncbi:DUF6608 family protein [Lutispora saccharofermentans]|mgnify:CR=1 FL=1|uniref:Uncharacterized protein n=1 Tax=Lutispora saccharofermentans TaxID=3024236 RepID=A0ABT1NFA7_9FIRM|nr:DUF6608 family protein [Lutispora saccharofermentans]MCQ1529945.1 hypothetical protein [Lutispora saccharofermentans]